MSLIEKLVTRRQRRQSAAMTQFLVGGSSDLGVPGYIRLIDAPETAAVIGKVADIISSAPIYLMRNGKEGDERIRSELARFMDVQPCRFGTRKDLIAWIVATMLSTGNAFCLPVTEGGLLRSIEPMPGAAILPPVGGAPPTVSWNGVTLPETDVLHFMFRPDLREPWRGAGVRFQLRDILDNLRQATATTNAFYKSEYKPAVVIKVDAMAETFDSPEGRQKLLDQYVRNQKAGQPWIIPADLMDVQSIKPLSLSDLAISSSVELDKRAVAAGMGVPPYLVGLGAYNDQEHNNFVRTMIVPLAAGIAQELTRKLLLSPELYFKFSARKLYSYSLRDLARIADDQYALGIMSGNEVRDWLDLTPVKGLGERVILENYIPKNKIGDQKKLNGGDNDAD